MMRAAARAIGFLRRERRPLRDRPIASIVTDLPDPSEAVRWLGDLNVRGESHAALFSHPRSTVTFRWRSARGERLTAYCTLLPDAWSKNVGGVEFRLIGRHAGRESVAVQVVRPGSIVADRRWHRLSLALPVDADVELCLETRVPD